MPGCIFAPYFPPEEPQKFANVHKIFGASNVTKLLNDLLPHQREDAVNSLAYEAEARVRDPVYGCVGAISFLQRQVERLQKELDAANAELIRFACSDSLPPLRSPQQRPVDLINSTSNNIGNVHELTGISTGDIASTYQTPFTSFSFPSTTAYPIPWNSTSFDNNTCSGDANEVGGDAGKGL